MGLSGNVSIKSLLIQADPFPSTLHCAVHFNTIAISKKTFSSSSLFLRFLIKFAV